MFQSSNAKCFFYSKIRIFKIVGAPKGDLEHFLKNIWIVLVSVLNVSAPRLVLSYRK